MRALLVVLMVTFVLCLMPVRTDATGTACVGVVMRVPLGMGLPVYDAPHIQAVFTGTHLVYGQFVQVYSTQYNPTMGDIWYAIDGGWAQAYSGYTTGFSQIILADFPCAQSLPHYVGN